MSNVQDTAPQMRALDLDDAADAILDRWTDGEDLSEESDELEATDSTLEEETNEDDLSETDEDEDYQEIEEETDEDPDSSDEDEEDDQEEDQDDNEEAQEATLSEDAMVEVQVDGENKQVSVKDLKRLYGQEASLTRKSQETAAKRKEAEEALSKADLRYQTLLQRAQARYKPYSEVDMLVASRQMTQEDFSALRKEAKEAEDDLKFLSQEADQFYQEAQAQSRQQQQAAAQECVKVLQEQLPEWGNELYNDIRTYAVSQGLPSEQVDQYVDPQVIMILNKARLYDQTKASASEKKAKAKVIKSKTSKGKVLRSKKAPASDQEVRARKSREASKRLRDNPSRSGDLDDIADALLRRWEQ